MRTALTIAGSDSGGGAGIQADLKTFAALGVYGTSAVTALTAQNTVAVTGVHVVPPAFIVAQIDAVVTDLGCDAVKTGMLGTAANVEAVAAAILRHRLPNPVVDPVMVAKSGDHLLAADAVDAMRRALVPVARLVTPNVPEAEVLSGMTIRSLEDAVAAARAIRAMGARAVIVKGGHLDRADIVDVLVDGDRVVQISGPRIPGVHTHGTGCTFAAAAAARLALGDDVEAAARAAQAYVREAMRTGVPLGSGHRPLDHQWVSRTASAPAASRYTLGLPVMPLATAISSAPLSVEAAIRAVEGPGSGAVATFVGLVRDHNVGRQVLWLDYEAYAPLAEKALGIIASEAETRWTGARVAIHHRTGRMEIGEASVVIAVATPHRADAFSACRYAIERIKQIVPIWKHEHFEGGEVWIEGATADATDEAAREAALKIACG